MSTDPLSLIAQRAAEQRRKLVLPVDYYRIRRRRAMELPMRSLPCAGAPVKGVPIYPWGIWAMWALEERVLTLGWAGQWLSDVPCQKLAQEQLHLLTTWPRYTDLGEPDLVESHCLRIMLAASRWSWVDHDTLRSLQQCCSQLVEQALPWSDRRHGSFTSVQSILDTPECERSILHNIPIIAAVTLARAARFASHAATSTLDRRASLLIRAILLRSKQGFTEGSSYDGYVLDFVGDWLADAGDAAEPQKWDAPALAAMLAQGSILAAPGDAMNIAPLGDVEPWHMPFLASACAKLLPRVADPGIASYLRSLPPAALRTDTLVAMLLSPANPTRDLAQNATPPRPLAQQTAHALSLRTGPTDDDLAVMISLPRTPMGHLHNDAGSIVIGAAGRWLITDPGYQQYVRSSEREFTLGPSAHNAPVINTHAQTLRQAKLLSLDDTDDLRHASVETTGCYAPQAGVRIARRHVWLWHDHAVVADELLCEGPHNVAYTWHGDETAYWLASDRGVCVTLPGHRVGESETDDTLLWIASPGLTLTPEQIDRLRGSRGQLSLSVQTECTSHASTRWWVFTRGSSPAIVRELPAERALSVDGRTIRLPESSATQEQAQHTSATEPARQTTP